MSNSKHLELSKTNISTFPSSTALSIVLKDQADASKRLSAPG
jgi:hypothetical protein